MDPHAPTVRQATIGTILVARIPIRSQHLDVRVLASQTRPAQYLAKTSPSMVRARIKPIAREPVQLKWRNPK
jgi:hypothetical protein